MAGLGGPAQPVLHCGQVSRAPEVPQVPQVLQVAQSPQAALVLQVAQVLRVAQAVLLPGHHTAGVGPHCQPAAVQLGEAPPVPAAAAAGAP
jgi:hypothetical protein